MSTISLVEPSSNEVLAQLEAKAGGKPNNFLRALAHRPESMSSFLAFYRTVMGPGSVDRRLKEMAYVAVASANECAFCLHAHLQAASKAGLTDAEVSALRDGSYGSFSGLDRAVLDYALDLTRKAKASGPQDTLAALLKPEQMVELTLVIAMANFTNRFNNGLGIMPED
jgi:uncharacterized peroxidase-related enzyme